MFKDEQSASVRRQELCLVVIYAARLTETDLSRLLIYGDSQLEGVRLWRPHLTVFIPACLGRGQGYKPDVETRR